METLPGTGLPAVLISFMDSAAGQALAALYVLAVIDLVVGIAAAVRDGVYQLDATSAWVRTNLSKLVIITATLVGGHLLGGLQISGLAELPGAAMTAAGLAGAAAYALGVIGSLQESLKSKPATVAVADPVTGLIVAAPNPDARVVPDA